jgi:hypothetical protein
MDPRIISITQGVEDVAKRAAFYQRQLCLPD